MKTFLIVFSLLASVLCFIIGRYYTSSFALSPNTTRVFWVMHIMATLTILIAPIVYRLYPTKDPGYFYNSIQWMGYFFMGLYSVMIIIILINDSSLSLFSRFSEVSHERRIFLKSLLAFASLSVSGVVAGVGFFDARKKPDIKSVSIEFDHLPESFHGFRILQMSDVHVGQTIRGDFVELIVEESNKLKPDLVVLTGDLVDGTTEQLKNELLAFDKLIAPSGVLMIPGNHEYYWGLEEWLAFWEDKGFKTLINEHILIEKNSERILVAGVHDYSAQRLSNQTISSPKDSLKNAPMDLVKILLAHQPRSVYSASKAGFDLQLSGHTHSGQYFPYNFLIYLFQPFVKGLHRFEKTWIYVNQGTGYWGPPTRFGVPPEITVIELKKKSASA